MREKKILDEMDIENFYENEDISKLLLDEDNDNIKILFVVRIIWKLMRDLDINKVGYNMDDWLLSDFMSFTNRLEEVDLNSDSYRNYFKYMLIDMVKGIKK